MKEEFLKLLRSIKREGIEDLIKFLESTDFFKPSVIELFKKPTTSLEEILKQLQNFLPGKDELKKEDSSLINE